MNGCPLPTSSYSDESTVGGQTYFYAVTAVGTNGLESDFSNHISFTVNRPPQAADDSATTQASSSATIRVLGNDSDPDGDALTIIEIGQASNGTATISSNAVVYTPKTGFSGSDAFSYTISDGYTGTDSATVTVQGGRARHSLSDWQPRADRSHFMPGPTQASLTT